MVALQSGQNFREIAQFILFFQKFSTCSQRQIFGRKAGLWQAKSAFDTAESGLLDCVSDMWVRFEEANVTHTSLFAGVWQPMVNKVEFIIGAQNLKKNEK